MRPGCNTPNFLALTQSPIGMECRPHGSLAGSHRAIQRCGGAEHLVTLRPCAWSYTILRPDKTPLIILVDANKGRRRSTAARFG